jgi:tetratricopeptide (TPR) repeat protein
MRLCSTCADCGFENPRGFVGCARCGALLGPRFRRADVDDSGVGHDTNVATLPRQGFDDEKTTVYEAPASPDASAHAGAPPGAARPRAAAVDARPLLGRDAAVERADRLIAEAFERGEARLLAFVGEAGSGRTRMLQRCAEVAAAREPNVVVHYAALRSRHDGPYAPLSRLLLERFGVTPASSPNRVRAEMESEVAAVLGDVSASTTVTHLIGNVAGVPFPDSAILRELTPGDLQGRAVAAVARFAEGEARARPQLWLLDDIDQAEDGTFELLAALITLPVPLVLVVSGTAALAARVARLPEPARASQQVLEPLAAEDTAATVKALVADLRDVPPELLAVIMHRTGGVPRQLVELVRALQTAGVFRREGAHSVVDSERFDTGSLPATISDSVHARLSALPAEELQALRDAAIIGEHFWDGALLALRRAREALPASETALEVWSRSEDELALQAVLDALESKGFLLRIAEPGALGLGELSFQLKGMRALMYAEISTDERARGHAVVAHWLELASGVAIDGQHAQLAPHLELAGATSRAAAAYLRAAAGERARMRTSAALSYAEKALSLADPANLVVQLDALHQRGALLTTLGRYDEALSTFSNIARLAWARGARARGAAALNRIGRIYRDRGEPDRALEHLVEALALFGAVDDQRGVAGTYDDIAQVHHARGELELALAAAEQALEIRVASRDARGQGVSLTTLGRIESDLGRHDSAQKRLRAALALRERLGDSEGAAHTRAALGQLAWLRGEVAEAVAAYTTALQQARALQHSRLAASLLGSLGAIYLAQRDAQRAETALREAHRMNMALGDHAALLENERQLDAIAERRAELGPRSG